MNTILEAQWSDNLFFRLRSNFDSRMALSDIQSVLLLEGFDYNSPIFIIRFVDGIGDLITHNRISPDAIYELQVGKTERDSRLCSFSLGKNKFTATNVASTNNMFSEIYFISTNWQQMIGQKRFRSWKDVAYSDVIQELAEESGFEEIDVEPTDGQYTVIQPGWTNYQLIKWIEKRAINSRDGVGGYETAVLSDQSFHFKTIHQMNYNRPRREFVLTGEDNGDSHKFFDIEIIQSYADMMKEGASGYTYAYYDYLNKEYVKEEKLPSETGQRQLSDWMYVAESHENPNNFFYGSRDTETENIVTNRLLETTNSIQKLKIKIEGDIQLRPGDIVNLIIQPGNTSKLPVNEFYSGYYMISQLNHEILFGKNIYMTELTLTRQGINSPDVEGFIDTSVGKDIRS